MLAQIPLPHEENAGFCRRHRILRLALFGSVLRRDVRAGSDVDVLVLVEPGEAPRWEFFEMEEELSRRLGRKVDLNTPGFLSPYFRDEVLAEAQTVYQRA